MMTHPDITDLRPPLISSLPPGVREWLAAFALAVRGQDYESGRRLFSEAIISFGTHEHQITGLDLLVERQWKRVWGVTRGFQFDLSLANGNGGGDIAWVALPWHSQGCSPTGEWFDRFGRATLILERENGDWKAVHSHFSRQPEPLGHPAASVPALPG
ncbi:MAG: nuclear transport factor 2 family protein [Cytophagales bacterium]|nr:nuclear transport factor 2 family protein [Armatimonadota bacterium]